MSTPFVVLDQTLPTCQGPGVCEDMQRDQEATELLRARQSTLTSTAALARIMAAVATGLCQHCKRPVR